MWRDSGKARNRERQRRNKSHINGNEGRLANTPKTKSSEGV